MRLSLSPRDRRVLIAGGAIVAAIFVVSRGFPAWRGWLAEQQSSAAEMTAEAAKLDSAIPLQRVLKDSLRSRRTRLTELREALLPGDTPSSAAATLASLVSSAARDAGVRLGAVQVRADSVGKTRFVRVAVQADATGDIRGVTRFLASLEGGTILLSVRELSVSSLSPGAPDTQAEALRVEIVVEGLASTGRREAGGGRREEKPQSRGRQ